MTIRNYNDFVSYIADTHKWSTENAIHFYFDSYHVKVSHSHTSVRLASACEDSPMMISCQFKFPFESALIDEWMKKFAEQSDELWRSCYDDPIDLLMNFTNPYENYTLAEMEKFVSSAIADGWRCPPDWTPQDFLDVYNDLEPNEEEEE